MNGYDPREDNDVTCDKCHEVVLEVVGNRTVPRDCRCDRNYEPDMEAVTEQRRDDAARGAMLARGEGERRW